MGLLVLLLCASAFADSDSDYQKARLISITDTSKTVTTAACTKYSCTYIPVTLVGINFNVQMGDVIYIGHHDIKWRWSYAATDFKPDSQVYVRLDGKHMYVKRPSGQDCKTLIVSRIDKNDLGTDASANPKKDAARHALWGRQLLQLDDVPNAVTQLGIAARLNPDDADLHIDLGEALRKVNDKEKALEEFRSAVRLKPKSSRAHALIGRMLLEKADPEGAMEELRTAIQLDSRSGYAHYNYGAALEAKGELSEALEEYNRALKFDRYDQTVLQAVRRVKGKLAANTANPAS
jgi:tetratricopeptide (TPR) repeat protein